MLLGALTMVYVLYGLGNSYSFKEELIMNKTLFVVLILLYPLTDLLRVFVLRIKYGYSPFVADQRHLHHLIIKVIKKQYFTTFFILLVELILIITVCSMYSK